MISLAHYRVAINSGIFYYSLAVEVDDVYTVGLILSTLVQEVYMISSTYLQQVMHFMAQFTVQKDDILGSIAIKCVLCYPSLKWCGKDVNFTPFDSVEK